MIKLWRLLYTSLALFETHAPLAQRITRDLAPVGDYTYDVKVKACSSTKSARVQALFCSSYACDGTDEEEAITLTMGDEQGGWTTTEVSLAFNPIGMRLEEVDETW